MKRRHGRSADQPPDDAALDAEHSLLLATLEATADGILVVDRGGKIVRFNQRFATLWKLPQEVLDSGDDDRAIGFVLSQLSDPEAFVQKVRDLYAHPNAESFDVLEFIDGRVFERYSIPQRSHDGVIGRVWSFRDVTQRVSEERERAAAEGRARRRLDRLESLWRLLTDVDLGSESLSETILREGRRSLGLDYAVLSCVDGEQTYDQVVSSERETSRVKPLVGLDATIASIVVAAGATMATNDLSKDPLFAQDPRVRRRYLGAAIGTPLRVGDRKYVLGFASRKPREEPFSYEDREYVELLAAYFGRLLRMNEQENQISYLAYHDSVTGLENRRRFLERVDEAIVRSSRTKRKFALLYVDLDRFKDVNDTFGHLAGDAVLAQAGDRLRLAVRSQDPAARFGGDEFALLLAELSAPPEAEAVAGRVCAMLENTFNVDGQEMQLSSSIGIAVFPDDGATAIELLRCADAALYRAKSQGRGRYCFYSQELASQLQHRRRLQTGLREALEREQFFLTYQPVMRLDGGIDAVEALLRWRHPERGTIFPGEFIDVAEETGLMTHIGKWVVRAAMRQAGAWAREGFAWRVAVNISVTQLQDPGFMSLVKAALADFGPPPEQFEIEITESAALRDPDAAYAVVTECRRLGMRVALDDFGTHYASLAHLKKLPFDIIKVDRSFVRGLPGDANDAAIVRSILALGENFGCAVVAEGVETKEQATWLRENGCRLAQGFLLAKPMMAEDLTLWASAERQASA